eukprot:756537-Hanusia_phi.AAC.2
MEARNLLVAAPVQLAIPSLTMLFSATELFQLTSAMTGTGHEIILSAADVQIDAGITCAEVTVNKNDGGKILLGLLTASSGDLLLSNSELSRLSCRLLVFQGASSSSSSVPPPPPPQFLLLLLLLLSSSSSLCSWYCRVLHLTPVAPLLSSAFANVDTAVLHAEGQGAGGDIRIYGPGPSTFLSLTLVASRNITFDAGRTCSQDEAEDKGRAGDKGG